MQLSFLTFKKFYQVNLWCCFCMCGSVRSSKKEITKICVWFELQKFGTPKALWKKTTFNLWDFDRDEVDSKNHLEYADYVVL